MGIPKFYKTPGETNTRSEEILEHFRRLVIFYNYKNTYVISARKVLVTVSLNNWQK